MTQFENNSGQVNGPQVGLKLKRHTEILRMSNVFVWRGHAIVFNSLVVTVSLSVCLDLKKYVQIIAIIIIMIIKKKIIIIIIIAAMKRNNFNRSQHMVSPCFWRKTIQIQFFHSHVATESVFVETKRNDFDFWESSSHQSH